MKICEFCHKQGLDFDRATDGPQCKNPKIYSPAVGDWICDLKSTNENISLQRKAENGTEAIA